MKLKSSEPATATEASSRTPTESEATQEVKDSHVYVKSMKELWFLCTFVIQSSG